jgi:hypothetical protein
MRTKDPQKAAVRKHVTARLRRFVSLLTRQFTTGSDELLRRTESKLAPGESKNGKGGKPSTR